MPTLPETALFLGVDTSANHTGLVILGLADNYPVLAHTIDVEKTQGPERLQLIRKTLEGLLAPYRFRAAVREAYSHGSTHRAFLLGEVGGLATLAMYEKSDLYAECAPSALKKFASSDARADKDTMCRVVETRWGYKTDDDNLADAYALAQVARALQNPQACTRPQLEVLATIRAAANGEKKKPRRAALRNTQII